ncbi:MAG: CDP-diacylglycerol--glycerol-3-phosphate 3-phosphatidyltransferase [Planctomycetia bacterium]|jgi:CDP-diacylglycerol--glycerol-3-phosphate 3-phosphatidyltransferase
MSNTDPQKEQGVLASSGALNLPNQLTTLRILLSIVMFAFLTFDFYVTSFVLFIIAAGTDWLDGYFARKYDMVTTLGRILDPFADKVIICGGVIFLAAAPGMQTIPWGFRAWMAVVIVGRELLVTALRGFIEQSGKDFSAKWVGKWKMLLQCVLVAAGMLILSYHVDLTSSTITDLTAEKAVDGSTITYTMDVKNLDNGQLEVLAKGYPAWLWWVFVLSTWSAIVLTIYSGFIYIQRAVQLARE